MGLGLSIDCEERERGFSLPHPPISLAILLTLESAISAAWNILHTKPPRAFDAKTAKEPDFTTHLHEILEDHLLNSGEVEGFTREVFTSVGRPEVRNFDGEKTAKKPDMVAYLADRPNVKRSQDGVFIECKPVDSRHSLVSDYCDAGVARFVVGDYAWAMTEALMVGYNSAHDKPSLALVVPFKQRARVVRSSSKLRDCAASPQVPVVATSTHKRQFLVNGKRAGEISLRHLWLRKPALY